MQAQQRTAYVQAQGDQGQRQPVARARECLLCGTQAMVVYGEGGPSVAQLRLPQQVGGDLWQLARSAGQPHGERPVTAGAAGIGDLGDLGRLCRQRSEEHTSELQSLMRISYAVF